MYEPEGMLHEEDLPGLMEKWPAHLHIDILDSFQGRGYGRLLVERFLGVLMEKKVPGVHLGMAGSNEGARRFYDNIGFRRFPGVLDGGKSGEEGRDGKDTVWFVKDV
jgi:GNAT superfamily N-acetyltransferase